MHEMRKVNCSSVVIFWLILVDVASFGVVFERSRSGCGWIWAVENLDRAVG